MPEALDGICRKIYSEVQQFYADKAPHHGNLGFQILYGPPLLRPPILFLGYQPGGGIADYQKELSKGSQTGWPEVCEYATEPWKLAERLRKMFGRRLLEQCMGLNAIFIRSPKIEVYRKTVSACCRKEIEDFCIPRAMRIVEEVQPTTVVSIGFATLDLFGGGMSGIVDERGKDLTRVGKICGRPFIGTVHLSGYRVSNANLDRIAQQILAT